MNIIIEKNADVDVLANADAGNLMPRVSINCLKHMICKDNR